MLDVNTFLLLITLLLISMHKNQNKEVPLYTTVNEPIEENSTVTYKCNKLSSLLQANVTSYSDCYIETSQVTKTVIHKSHKLLSLLYTNVTSY